MGGEGKRCGAVGCCCCCCCCNGAGEGILNEPDPNDDMVDAQSTTTASSIDVGKDRALRCAGRWICEHSKNGLSSSSSMDAAAVVVVVILFKSGRIRLLMRSVSSVSSRWRRGCSRSPTPLVLLLLKLPLSAADGVAVKTPAFTTAGPSSSSVATAAGFGEGLDFGIRRKGRLRGDSDSDCAPFERVRENIMGLLSCCCCVE